MAVGFSCLKECERVSDDSVYVPKKKKKKVVDKR